MALSLQREMICFGRNDHKRLNVFIAVGDTTNPSTQAPKTTGTLDKWQFTRKHRLGQSDEFTPGIDFILGTRWPVIHES